MGPAGAGKSTYCQALQDHAVTHKRRILVANLDPAAEHFGYDVALDIRELITVEEVMEELGLGPNGALIYCLEYLLEHLNWLQDALEELDDDEYMLLDCPGQIELYTHVPIMKRILETLQIRGFGLCSVFCVDASFLTDHSKFLSGSLLSLSAMIAMELPHVNILTKCDLAPSSQVDKMLSNSSAYDVLEAPTPVGSRQRLTQALAQVLDDYSMVSFLPLNITDEESLDHVLLTVDHALQYGEDADVKVPDDRDEDE